MVSVNLTPYKVTAGDIVVVLPGQLHSISSYENAHMEYENILFMPDMLKSRTTDSCNLDCLNPILNGYPYRNPAPKPRVCRSRTQPKSQ